MSIIDVLNQANMFLHTALPGNAPSRDNSDEYRFLVVDPDNQLAIAEEAINRCCIENAHKLCHVSEEKHIRDAIKPVRGRRVQLAVVAKAGRLDLIRHLLSALSAMIEEQVEVDSTPVTQRLKLNIFLVFGRKQINEKKCHEAAEPLAEALYTYFIEGKDRIKRDMRFPACTVIHAFVDTNGVCEEDSEYEQEINFQMTKLGSQIFYLHTRQGAVLKPESTDLFTKTSYPWMTYFMRETYGPELLLFENFIQCVQQAENVTEQDMINGIRESVEEVRESFLRAIGVEKMSQRDEKMRVWSGYMPIAISGEEWARSSDLREETVTETVKQKGLFGLGRQKQVSRTVHRPIGAKTNSSSDKLIRSYSDYIRSTVPPEGFCELVFRLLPGLYPRANIATLVQELRESARRVFSGSEASNQIWSELREFYVTNIDKKIVQLCYDRFADALHGAEKAIASQNDQWKLEAAYPPRKLQQIIGYKLKLCPTEEGYYTQICDFLKQKQQDEQFLEQFRATWAERWRQDIPNFGQLPAMPLCRFPELDAGVQKIDDDDPDRKKREIHLRYVQDFDGLKA